MNPTRSIEIPAWQPVSKNTADLLPKAREASRPVWLSGSIGAARRAALMKGSQNNFSILLVRETLSTVSHWNVFIQITSTYPPKQT